MAYVRHMTALPTGRRRPTFDLQHRLVLARETASLDQIDLARALEVSRATISNFERGVSTPKRIQLREWAAVTDVDDAWLQYGESGQPTPPAIGGGRHFLFRERPEHDSNVQPTGGLCANPMFPVRLPRIAA